MARIDYDKARRAEQWRQATYAGLGDRAPAAPAKRATAKQLDFIQGLLKKTGRRQLSRAELAVFTMDSASRMIKTLMNEQPAN
jgi:hypothetical protein